MVEGLPPCSGPETKGHQEPVVVVEACLLSQSAVEGLPLTIKQGGRGGPPAYEVKAPYLFLRSNENERRTPPLEPLSNESDRRTTFEGGFGGTARCSGRLTSTT